MAEGNGNGGGGEVVDQPKDRGEPIAVEERDQRPLETVTGTSIDAMNGGDGNQGRDEEAAGGGEHRAMKIEPRVTDQAGVVGPRIEPLDPSTAARGSVATNGGSGDAGSGGDPHAPKLDARVMDEVWIVGPNVEPEGSSSVAEGSPVVDRGSKGAKDSGVDVNDTGPSEFQPKDSDKGNGVAVEEERTT
ncbi:hypothetical protein RHMOL_Rhmol04G0204000 [Rhododendron molle]|uniref:Uncharacterized protein n=1 Tax=Rhododendron molle TaxID=49168 RepID=A0ACC0P3N4_RHOML|nr:hypothetical protein RHMOL_Rhmol04G0204000 [Rhododendron molle]